MATSEKSKANSEALTDITSQLNSISLKSTSTATTSTARSTTLTSTPSAITSNTTPPNLSTPTQTCHICIKIASHHAKKSRPLYSNRLQRGPSTVCRLCKRLFCAHHSSGIEGEREKVCQINHVTYYKKDRHKKVGENGMIFESLESRLKELGEEGVEREEEECVKREEVDRAVRGVGTEGVGSVPAGSGGRDGRGGRGGRGPRGRGGFGKPEGEKRVVMGLDAEVDNGNASGKGKGGYWIQWIKGIKFVKSTNMTGDWRKG